MLALQYQFQRSEWWSAEELLKHQFRELESLLAHARSTVPHYAERYAALPADSHKDLTPEGWARLPLLTRNDIQTAGERLHSRAVPKDHGAVYEVNTSGSTGRPIKALVTDVTRFFWNAFTLREHLWHGRDLGGKLASIRSTVQDGAGRGWG
ncbi:MAG: hypothetical protein ACREUA_04550, partial [Burkholderiales bacterium]